jgi:dihydrofolate synthase/folylpolyglutamate synthase
MKSYQQTLDFLFSQLPMYQRQGAAAMKKNLDNILALCEVLGNPQNKFKSIHIAGTNGKGSVTHILASILQKSGLKVGCYTSPHYKDFRERIKINANFISEKHIIDFVEHNKDLMLKIQPSFFEITVAMAFQYFAQEKVDIAIIETGLGGRLDSTNIITPLLSIITNISKDHTQFLGETLEEIAFEKAGIIKQNVPVIIGKKQQKTKEVFRKKALETKSELFYASSIVKLSRFKSTFGKRSSFKLKHGGKTTKLKTDLIGNYQQENIQTAIAAIFYLKKKKILKIKKTAIFKGIRNIQKDSYFIGRNMILATKPLIIADSAHNVAGIKELVTQINAISYEKLHFVYGTVSDKDVATIFTLLPKEAQFYFCKPAIIRGMETDSIEKIAHEFNFNYKSFDSVNNALLVARKNANENDLIIIGGSIFVVAEAF